MNKLFAFVVNNIRLGRNAHAWQADAGHQKYIIFSIPFLAISPNAGLYVLVRIHDAVLFDTRSAYRGVLLDLNKPMVNRGQTMGRYDDLQGRRGS